MHTAKTLRNEPQDPAAGTTLTARIIRHCAPALGLGNGTRRSPVPSLRAISAARSGDIPSAWREDCGDHIRALKGPISEFKGQS